MHTMSSVNLCNTIITIECFGALNRFCAFATLRPSTVRFQITFCHVSSGFRMNYYSLPRFSAAMAWHVLFKRNSQRLVCAPGIAYVLEHR